MTVSVGSVRAKVWIPLSSHLVSFPIMNDFSERVKQVRKQMEISQEDLAHALGVSFATVNRWENRKAKPSKLARRQFDLYCKTQFKQGRIDDLGKNA